MAYENNQGSIRKIPWSVSEESGSPSQPWGGAITEAVAKVEAAREARARVEAVTAAREARVRVEAVTAASEARARVEAVTAASEARARVEAVTAASEARARVEAVTAASEARARVEAVTAAREARARVEAAEPTLGSSAVVASRSNEQTDLSVLMETCTKSLKFEPDGINIDVPLRPCFAEERGAVEFQCRVSNSEIVHWYHNGIRLHETSRVWITFNDPWFRLGIQDIKASDHGVYTIVCQRGNTYSTSQAMLFVKNELSECPDMYGALYISPPKSKLQIVKHLGNVTVKTGDAIFLKAQVFVSSEHKIEHSWWKDHDHITPSEKQKMYSDPANGYYLFNTRKAEPSDSGMYTLVVKSCDAYVSSICEVVVLDNDLSHTGHRSHQGFIEPLPEEIELNYTEKFRLSCRIREDFTLIQWFKDQTILKESRAIQFECYGQGFVGLTIFNPFEYFSGQYTIAVKNIETGHICISSCFVYINKLKIMPTLPIASVDIPLKTTLGVLGGELSLCCSFSTPPIKYMYVVWNVGMLKVERSNKYFQLTCQDDGVYIMYIKKLAPEMLGETSCELRYVHSSQASFALASTRGSIIHLPSAIIHDDLHKNKKGIFAEKCYHTIGSTSANTIWISSKRTCEGNLRFQRYTRRSNPPFLEETSATSTTQSPYEQQDAAAHLLQGRLETAARTQGGLAISSSSLDSVARGLSSSTSYPRSTSPEVHDQGCYAESSAEFTETVMQMVLCILLDVKTAYFMMLDKICHKEIFIQAEMNEKNSGVIIKWENDRSNLTPSWYGIELKLSNDNYGIVGVSSLPQFEITNPKTNKIMIFRIRRVPPRHNTSLASISVQLPEDPPPKLETCVDIKQLETFGSKYNFVGGVLGCGAYGSVCLVKSVSGVYFAAKVIKTRTQKKRDQAIREYSIMQRLNHPQLVRLYDAYYARDQFIMIMDFLWGGELFERIVEEDNFKEATAVIYVRQLCEGLNYLHKRNIAHLDLKPENVVCLSPNSRHIKIVDFGLSRVLDSDTVRAIYGTRDYIAPEALNYEPLTTSCDMWSLGVVTYVMLSGVIPFAGDTWAARSVNITRASYNYEEPALETVSQRAKEFIDQLLVKTPARRMTAERALQHRWLVHGPPSDVELSHSRRWRANLRSYLAINKARWQRAGNVVIAANRLRTRVVAAQCARTMRPS